MADIFNKQQASRLFGFIASGSSIGAIVGPLLALTLVNRVGQGNLLLISAGLLLIPMVIIVWLERLKHTELHNEALNAQQDYQQILGSSPLAGFMLWVAVFAGPNFRQRAGTIEIIKSAYKGQNCA